VTHTLPVYEGYCMPHAVLRLDFGGSRITEYLIKLLNDRGCSFTTLADREIVRNIKETLAFVTLDFEEESETSATSSITERSYKLPDGNVITLGVERFHCTEPLFNPSLLGIKAPSFQEMLFNTIMKSGFAERRDNFKNIFISGGNSLFPGFLDRLQKELKNLLYNNFEIKITAPPNRIYSSWIGGSIFASLSNFFEKCITAEEYNESGPSIVHRKCF